MYYFLASKRGWQHKSLDLDWELISTPIRKRGIWLLTISYFDLFFAKCNQASENGKMATEITRFCPVCIIIVLRIVFPPKETRWQRKKAGISQRESFVTSVVVFWKANRTLCHSLVNRLSWLSLQTFTKFQEFQDNENRDEFSLGEKWDV